MTDGVKKYRGGLLALGAGLIFDNPLMSALGLFMLYNKAGEGEGEEQELGQRAGGARAPLAAWEIGYNRAIFVLGLGLVLAGGLHERPLVALGIVATTTLLGGWLIRRAGRLERQVDLFEVVEAFMGLVTSRKLGYSITPLDGLTFQVKPLWLPQPFVVSVLPGQAATATPTVSAGIPVHWLPRAPVGKPVTRDGVLVVKGGADALEAALREAMSAVVLATRFEVAPAEKD